MANIRFKTLSPHIFQQTQPLVQASGSFFITNTGDVHNLVEGDTWTLTFPPYGYAPSKSYVFYFGSLPSPGQIGIPIAGQTASQVAASIASIIQTLDDRLYLYYGESSGASFTLYAGYFMQGSIGNSITTLGMMGKISVTSPFQGGQDSIFSKPNFFNKNTYGIILNPKYLNDGFIASYMIDFSPRWEILPTSLSFSGVDCSVAGSWITRGWGIGGSDLTVRPDFTDPVLSEMCLSSLKGFLIQGLGNASAFLNPYNWDLNVDIVAIKYKDSAEILFDGTTALFGVAYFGNQNSYINGLEESLSFSSPSTSYGPNLGQTVTVKTKQNMVFDTIPELNSKYGLPLLGTVFKCFPNFPGINQDVGLLEWKSPVSTGLSRHSAGFPAATSGGIVYKEPFGLGGVRVVYSDYWFDTLEYSDSFGFVLNLVVTLEAIPDSPNTLVDISRSGSNGIKAYIDTSGVFHFLWGSAEITTALNTNEIYCLTFQRSETHLSLFVNSLTSTYSTVIQVPFVPSGVTAGTQQLTFLGDNTGGDLALSSVLHGIALYTSSNPSYLSGFSEKSPVGLFLPSAIHQFWINYLISSEIFSSYQGSSPPAFGI